MKEKGYTKSCQCLPAEVRRGIFKSARVYLVKEEEYTKRCQDLPGERGRMY